MLKPDLNEATHASTTSTFTVSTTERAARWADGKGQWVPFKNSGGTGSNWELVFDLEEREIRWQPASGSPGDGSAEQEYVEYPVHVDFPEGPSPDIPVLPSAECSDLADILIEGSEVNISDDGQVAVWCSDAAYDAWRSLLAASLRWTTARDAARGRA